MPAGASEQSILVVGAGPVGLTAALELARRGFKPRIIDKASAPAGQSRAINLTPRTLDLLEQSGVTEGLLAAGNRIRRIEVVDGRARRLLTLRLERLRHRFPFWLVVPQSETERLLTIALAELGIEIEWNTELMDIMWFGERVEAVVANEAASETVEPSVLIGADGAHSTVRDLSRIGFEGTSYPAVFALADIRYAFPRDAGVATLEVFPGGAVATVPIDEYTLRHAGTSGDIVELVKNRRSAAEILWHSTLQVNLRNVASLQRGKAFLAGDAAHGHAPIGSRALNLGIEDAAWLAHMVENGSEKDYTAVRLPVARKVVRQSRAEADRLMQHNMLPPSLWRTLVRSALYLPFAEQLALQRLSGLDTPRPPWLA